MVPNINKIMSPSLLDISCMFIWPLKNWSKRRIYLVSKWEKIFSRIGKNTKKSNMVHISGNSRIILWKGIIKILTKEFLMGSKTLLELIDHIKIGYNSRVLYHKTIFASKGEKRSPHKGPNHLFELLKRSKYIFPIWSDSNFICIGIKHLIRWKKRIRFELF